MYLHLDVLWGVLPPPSHVQRLLPAPVTQGHVRVRLGRAPPVIDAVRHTEGNLEQRKVINSLYNILWPVTLCLTGLIASLFCKQEGSVGWVWQTYPNILTKNNIMITKGKFYFSCWTFSYERLEWIFDAPNVLFLFVSRILIIW